MLFSFLFPLQVVCICMYIYMYIIYKYMYMYFLLTGSFYLYHLLPRKHRDLRQLDRMSISYDLSVYRRNHR